MAISRSNDLALACTMDKDKQKLTVCVGEILVVVHSK